MNWVYFIGSIVVAFLLYWLRNNQRIWYGITEIVAALVLLGMSCGVIHQFGLYYLHWYQSLANVTSWFVGVYVFVRGWDDVIRTLRQ